MPDDANFCDGRLRLTAFLQVVENGMPSRPSRFKRRVPLEQTSHDDSALQEPLCLEERLEDLPISTSSRTPGLDTEAESEVPSAQDTDFNVTCSPTPMRLHVYPYSGKHLSVGSSNEGSDHEQRTTAHAILQAFTDERAVQAWKIKTKPSRPPKAIDTRKRQLPTTGLALVRTTTSDGLPNPSDVCSAFAVPITDFDPIDDSQLTRSVQEKCSTRRSNRRANQSTGAIAGCATKSHDSFSVNLVHAAILRPNNRTPLRKPNLGALAGSCFVADGFVGTELTTEATRKPQRCAKIVPRQNRRNNTKAGLVLADGLLPLPTVQSTEMTTGSKHKMGETPQGPHSSKLNSLEVKAKPRQLDLVRTSAEIDISQIQFQQVQRTKHTVQSQLSSTTAPIRREPESLTTDRFNEGEPVINGEEEAYDFEELDKSARLQPVSPLYQRSITVEEYDFFEDATYHLGLT